MAGHIAITVGSTTTEYLVDPNSYSEVDITDFAPRAVSGTPAFSELGLYLDVAQEKWDHGYGQWRFSEPQSYSFTGDLVDTRHKGITLMTADESLYSVGSSWKVNKLLDQGGYTIMADTNGLSAIRPSNSERATLTNLGGEIRDILSNGKYLYLSRSGRMKVAWVGTISNVVGYVITLAGADFEDTNQWVGNGVFWVFDGTGYNQTPSITASTTNTVTVSGWDGGLGTPVPGDVVLITADTGKNANPPNGFDNLGMYGGYFWGVQKNTNYLHFWAETNGSDAEGGGELDANVVTVGPKGRSILRIFPFNNQLWAFRADGAWTIGEDNLAYHTLDFADQVSTLNFSFVTVWDGFMIFPIRNTLYKYRSGLQDITPPVWSEDPPYKQFGAFYGGVIRGKFMYILGKTNAVNTSDEPATESHAFVSLLATDGVGWHKVLDLKTTAAPSVYRAWLDADSDYLYMYALDGTTGKLFRLKFQQNSDLPYASYPTTGDHRIYTSYYDFGMRRVPKSFASLTLHGRHTTSVTSITVQYRLDTTTAWSTLGTFTSDFEEIAFPAGTTGKRIQMRFNLQTTSSVSTPIIKAAILKTMLRPDVLYGVTADIIVSDNLSDQNRLMLGSTANELRAALKAARASVAPVTFKDIYGVSASAYLASLRFLVLEYEDTGEVQAIARCTFVYV